ncbi:DUF421 domain-containing protein [Bacillus sp. 165]|uniref:DUF421 domain-containing protein n=1 Tax=Bacillus sp. 165 TaxID=1529117 RepID=UPI001ADD3B26|nr:DUF421 domain-containing protein [Bacillus sp. 165]MBO9129410.1 DUF421 domain-containing protein [Bacillus sp. 165]
MHDIIESILRTFVSFCLLMIMANKLGKTVNSTSTYYNFVFYITIGSVAANLAFNLHIKSLPMIASFLSFTFITLGLAHIATKSRHIRRWISGQPAVIIQNGKIVEENMKKLNMTLDMLQQLLREKDIFDIKEVEYVVLENSGKISVLKKEAYRNPTKQELGMFSAMKNKVPLELIINGEFVHANLQSAYPSKEWLLYEVKKRNLIIKDIQYAVLSSADFLFIQCFKDEL